MSATRAQSRRYNAYQRYRGPDDPVTLEAEHDLRFERLRDQIHRAVSGLPPLTAEQVGQLRILLAGGAVTP